MGKFGTSILYMSSMKNSYFYVEELYPHKTAIRTSIKTDERKKFIELVYRYIKISKLVDVIRGRNVCFQTLSRAFQESMRLPLLIGQCMGLVPVTGILDTDLRNVRFELCSYRLLYSVVMCVTQLAATLLCLYKVLDGPVTVRKLGNFAFYLTTCITSVVFLQVARRWRQLLARVAASRLDSYIDPSVKFKCYFATITLFGTALFEHFLVLVARLSVVTDCMETDQGVYPKLIERMVEWIFSSVVTYQFPMGIILLAVNFISTINWSYSYIFIICISLFLTSILQQINKKIKESEKQYHPPSHWRQLREDYNRATLLVREFDDVIASVIFFAFASSLFFVCLQLFNTLTNVKATFDIVNKCPHHPSGLFGGAELVTYYLYSLVFIIGRFLAVALVAADVHAASRAAAQYLYNLPAASYCSEVHRFIQQIQGSFIALSGLNYFYVTKEHILSVAATIVTYELVLLQIDD